MAKYARYINDELVKFFYSDEPVEGVVKTKEAKGDYIREVITVEEPIVRGVFQTRSTEPVVTIDSKGKYVETYKVTFNPLADMKKILEDRIDANTATSIEDLYPLWKQLNVIRGGNEVEIHNMGMYIDGKRAFGEMKKKMLASLTNPEEVMNFDTTSMELTADA